MSTKSERERRSNSKETKLNNTSSSSFLSRSSFGSNTSSNNGTKSPTRLSRLQEKEDLQNLNDRLIIYIDTVRRLETENHQLKQQVHQYSSTSTRDVGEIKRMYQGELEGSKALIDQLAKDIAKKDIDLNKFKLEAEEALKRLNRADTENKALLNKLKASESEAIEYKSRLEALQKEAAHNSEELSHLRPQYNEMEKTADKLKKQLEDETLARIDLENKIQTLKEDLAFKSQIYTRETNQLRTTKMVELEQVDVRLRDEYDSKLVNELNRIRNDTDQKINDMREDMERKYNSKLLDAQRVAEKSKHFNHTMNDEMKSMKSRIEEMTQDAKISQQRKDAFEKRIKELEESLRNANKRYDQDMDKKDFEIEALRRELDETLIEYRELYDIKIALDLEIQAYRKLLESEEQRLNISNVDKLSGSYINETSTTTSSRSNKKRKYTGSDDSADHSQMGSTTNTFSTSMTSKGSIEFGDFDPTGRSVKLVNNSTTSDIQINGWTLRRDSNGEQIFYKFPKGTVIKSKDSVTVWSSNSGITNDPPKNILSNQKWNIGDEMITILTDKEGKEQARVENLKTLAAATSSNTSQSTSFGSKLLGKFF